MRPVREPRKVVNVEQTVRYLNHSFAKTLSKVRSEIGYDNTSGTDLHKIQVNFCYLIDEIQRGPMYISPKKISKVNELIERLSTYTA